MRVGLFALLLLGALGACRNNESANRESSSSSSPTPLDVKGKQSIDDLFGEEPALPKALANLTLIENEKELRAKLDAVLGINKRHFKLGDKSVSIEFGRLPEEPIAWLAMTRFTEEDYAKLEKRWGRATYMPDNGQIVRMWHNPKQNVRVQFVPYKDQFELRFDSFRPISAALQDVLECKYIGQSPRKVLQDFPRARPSARVVGLLSPHATPYSKEKQSILFNIERGEDAAVVYSCQTSIDFALDPSDINQEVETEVKGKIQALTGPWKQVEQDGVKYQQAQRGGRMIRIERKPASFEIYVASPISEDGR